MYLTLASFLAKSHNILLLLHAAIENLNYAYYMYSAVRLFCYLRNYHFYKFLIIDNDPPRAE